MSGPRSVTSNRYFGEPFSTDCGGSDAQVLGNKGPAEPLVASDTFNYRRNSSGEERVAPWSVGAVGIGYLLAPTRFFRVRAGDWPWELRRLSTKTALVFRFSPAWTPKSLFEKIF
jgi:hypothetical protein